MSENAASNFAENHFVINKGKIYFKDGKEVKNVKSIKITYSDLSSLPLIEVELLIMGEFGKYRRHYDNSFKIERIYGYLV